MRLDTELPLDARLYLPHRPPMSLIDRIVELGEDSLQTEVTIGPTTMFLRDGAVPAWVGVEYMAQSCAAFAGCEARARGDQVRVGFLLGAREYRTVVSGFELGSVLRVHIDLEHREAGGLGVVQGRISHRGQASALVEATLTLYEVADLAAYMRQNRGEP
jgi:predicted hotdog family 3-hydroxylacyl-ACP dehydratase